MTIINDNYIINTFFKDNKYLSSRLKKSWLDKHKDIFKYLLTRYNDSDSLQETIFRIKYNIEVRPVCEYCGGKVKFNNSKLTKFNSYCSPKCGNLDPIIKEKRIKSSIDKYGEHNYNNRIKCKETCLKKYGVDNVFKNKEIQNKYKETCLERYGVDNTFKVQKFIEEIKTKKIKTCLERYGVDNVAKVDEIKKKIYKSRDNNNLIKYGVKYVKQLDWVKQKEYETKKKNKTFNTSNSENESYQLLKEKYSDTLYQYKSDVYPFACDFYIPSLDLYIECNYHWTHGGHPFDSKNENDQLQLNEWVNKNTEFYNNAIGTWTIRDINKRNIAKQNNLNYIEFWNINELKDWLIKI